MEAFIHEVKYIYMYRHKIPYSRGGFVDIYFREFREFLLVAKIYFAKFLGATPSSRSAPTWVWSGFGLIGKTFFEKFAAISNSQKYRSAEKNPAIR